MDIISKVQIIMFFQDASQHQYFNLFRTFAKTQEKKTGTRLIFVQHMSGFSALFQSRLFFIILYTFPAFFYQPSIIRGQTVIHCMFSIYTFPRERKRKGENSSASPPDHCNWKSLFFNYCTRRFEEGNCGSFFMESTHAALFLSRFKVIFLFGCLVKQG